MQLTASRSPAPHLYEVRPRKDHRGVDLISDALPFGRLWYAGPNAVANVIGYATRDPTSSLSQSVLWRTNPASYRAQRVGRGVKSKGRVAQIGSFEKKIVQKVAMVC